MDDTRKFLIDFMQIPRLTLEACDGVQAPPPTLRWPGH